MSKCKREQEYEPDRFRQLYTLSNVHPEAAVEFQIDQVQFIDARLDCLEQACSHAQASQPLTILQELDDVPTGQRL